MRIMKKVLLATGALVVLATAPLWGQAIAPVYTGIQIISSKALFAPSTTSYASVSLGQGVTPTSLSNGDEWITSAGVYAYVNGSTVGPFGSTSTPCPTCATTTNGGPLTATSPMAINGSGVISLGTQPWTAGINFDNQTTVTSPNTYAIFEPWVWTNSGTISNVTYHTGGTTPSFTFSLQINGTNITGCTGIVVTSGTDATSTCSALNTITNGQRLTIAITAASGTPSAAWIQVSGLKPAS